MIQDDPLAPWVLPTTMTTPTVAPTIGTTPSSLNTPLGLSSGQLSAGAIAGIVVGVLSVLVLLAAGTTIYLRRYKTTPPQKTADVVVGVVGNLNEDVQSPVISDHFMVSQL